MTQLGAGYHNFWPRGLLVFLGRRKDFSSYLYLSLFSFSSSSWNSLIPLRLELSKRNALIFGGEKERSWPVHGEAGCSRHHASTAGASSLHKQGRNAAQPGTVVQGLGQGMPMLHGILVSRSFMFAWNHNAPRACVHPEQFKLHCKGAQGAVTDGTWAGQECDSTTAVMQPGCLPQTLSQGPWQHHGSVKSVGSFPQTWVGFTSSTQSRCGLGRDCPLDYSDSPLVTARKMWGVWKNNIFCCIFGICSGTVITYTFYHFLVIFNNLDFFNAMVSTQTFSLKCCFLLKWKSYINYQIKSKIFFGQFSIYLF